VLCPLKNIVGRLSLRIQQLDVICETKTRDNVFVQVSLLISHYLFIIYTVMAPAKELTLFIGIFFTVQVAVAVQFRVLEDGAYAAYYRLTNPRGQIQSYVFDVVRSTVPRMELDQAFSSKDEIASAALSQLQDVMKEYGYEILNTLVTDLSPDHKVKASMNEINASKRLKEAASHKAEADKIKQVKAAEAEAEAR
jgi:hypothetical protein